MKFKITLLALLLSTSSHAAFNGLSHHSRANCVGFNESVSWDATNWWLTYVRSEHIDAVTGTVVHTMISEWVLSWRNALYHFPEGFSGWIVHGTHWMKKEENAYIVQDEYTDNCVLYDGWWDAIG